MKNLSRFELLKEELKGISSGFDTSRSGFEYFRTLQSNGGSGFTSSSTGRRTATSQLLAGRMDGKSQLVLFKVETV